MVLNAILNALKSGLQRDPQRIEERSSTRSLNASKSDLQRVEGGVPFFLLRLRMRRNHNGLACRNYLRGLLLRANRGSRRNAEWLQRASEEPERRRSDESGNGKPFPPLTGHWSGRNRAPPSVLIGGSGWGVRRPIRIFLLIPMCCRPQLPLSPIKSPARVPLDRSGMRHSEPAFSGRNGEFTRNFPDFALRCGAKVA